MPFEAVVVPGGFLATPKPGRITLVNVDDPKRTEYVVVEAGSGTPDCSAGKGPDQIRNDRWFYHQALFHDMDGDGLKDLITARANLMPFMYQCPPVGELVWFRNPGAALKPDVPWEIRVLVGLPAETNGPEVNMALSDLDADGVPEIIATHFFTSDNITVFGAPAGGQWKDVDPVKRPLRRKAIMTGQGRPFAVEPEDLNGDGRLEILTSNHQGDGCFDVTKDVIPGRVIALEQPASGKLFDEDWTTHILKDNIRPNPTFPKPVRGPGRLAPNRAIAFWPEREMEEKEKPLDRRRRRRGVEGLGAEARQRQEGRLALRISHHLRHQRSLRREHHADDRAGPEGRGDLDHRRPGLALRPARRGWHGGAVHPGVRGPAGAHLQLPEGQARGPGAVPGRRHARLPRSVGAPSGATPSGSRLADSILAGGGRA